MKKRLLTIVPFLLGLFLCGYPLISSLVERQHQQNAVATYKGMINKESLETLKESTERAKRYVLKVAMRKWLSAKEQKKQEKRQIKVAGKSEKRRIRERNKIKQKEMPRGKQNLRKLMDQKMELKNIPITKDNIKSFDRIARKYGVDYSLKKDVASKGTPKYLVFFKAKDVDVITAAFQEYAGVTLKKKEKRASVHKKLENAKMVVKNRARKEKQRIRQKIKHREQSR